MNIFELIEKYSETEKVAIQYNDEQLTYKELFTTMIRFAKYLDSNFCDTKPVVIYGHKDNYMIPFMLGSILARRPYVPVDHIMKDDRLISITKQIEPSVFVNLSEYTLCGEEYGENILNKMDILEAIKDIEVSNIDFNIKNEQLCYIIFTSGSTGAPKGVQINWKNLNNYMNNTKGLNYFDSNKHKVLNSVVYSFDFSVGYIYQTLAEGNTLVSIDNEMIANMNLLFETIKNNNVELLPITPSMVSLLLSSKKFTGEYLPSVNRVYCLGEVLSPSVVNKLFERFENIKVYNSYGPTEATILVSEVEILKEDIDLNKALSIGKAVDTIDLKIFDKDGIEVKDGETGELVIIGEHVSESGYFKRPDLTEKVFYYDENYNKFCYKTGDLCYKIGEEYFYIGREDLQIKIHGHRLEIEDIENNLDSISYIAKSCVVPMESDGVFEYLVAFVILSDSVGLSGFKLQQKIKKDLGEKLPSYMIPKVIIEKTEFLVTPSFKTDRKKLIQEYKETRN